MNRLILRVIYLITLIFSISSLSGCLTSAMWKHNPPKTKEYVQYEEFNDNIVASFKYENFVLERDTTVKCSNFCSRYPSSGIGLVGEKYIYLVEDGGSSLEQMNDVIQTVPLIKFKNIDSLKQFNYYKANSGSPVPSFSGDFSIFTVDRSKLNEDEITSLKKYGFTENKDGYYKGYIIIGMIFTREQLRFNFYPKDNLAMKYNLVFLSSKEEERNNPSRTLRNFALTPFTLVGDAVLLPLVIIATPIVLLTTPIGVPISN